MKKLICGIGVLLLFSCESDDQAGNINEVDGILTPQVVWAKNFGGSGEDTPRSVIETMDGGLAVLGFTNSTDLDLAEKSLPVNDYWLLKLDSSGNLEWSKTYGGSKDDRGQQVIQTSDGGYAITGYAMSDDGDGSNNEGFHDNWIIRLDGQGNIQWERSFGFAGHDHSYDLVETADGGFFFSGFLDVTSSNGLGSTDKGTGIAAHGVGEFWGTKIDGQGNLQWRKYFGGTNNDRSFGTVNAHDGGYIMIGASESDDFDISDPKGSYDYWAVKVDKNGNFEWERSFGGTGIEQAQDIAPTEDGSYVIVGNTFSTDIQVSKNNGESDIWLIKIDENGTLLWEKSFGGTGFEDAHSVKRSRDGGFLICGNSKSADGDASNNVGENDIWLLKTDSQGNLEWEIAIGGSGLDFGYDALELSNQDIVLVGETASPDFSEITSKGSVDLVLLRITLGNE